MRVDLTERNRETHREKERDGVSSSSSTTATPKWRQYGDALASFHCFQLWIDEWIGLGRVRIENADLWILFSASDQRTGETVRHFAARGT